MEPTLTPDGGRPSTPALIRGVRRSVAFLAAGEVVNKAMRFAATIVLARSLSLDEFGLLNVGVAIGGIAVVLFRLGLPDLGTREVAADPPAATALAGRVVAPQLVGLLTTTVAVAVTVATFAPESIVFAVAATASMLGMAVSADWLLRGQERMRQLGTATAVGGVATLIGAVIAVAVSHSAVAALAAFAVAELISATMTWWYARLDGRPRLRLRGANELLRRSWPMGVSGVVIYAYYANIDTLIIAATRSTDEAGIYSGAYRLFLTLNAVVIFAGQAVLPVATRLTSAGDGAERTALLSGILKPLLAYGLVCAAGPLLLGRFGLEFVFGDAFGAGADTLILLCLSVPWYAMGFPVGYALIANDRGRRYMAGAITGFVLDMALCAILIPPLGIEGAGIATLIAFAAATLIWLHAQGLLRQVAPEFAVLLGLTAVSVGSLAAGVTTVPAGLLVLAAALALLRSSRMSPSAGAPA